MPIDPTIALRAGPTPNIGPDVGQIMQFQQMQEQQRARNALQQILSQPDALDGAGNPTPNTLKQVMGVSPDIGMKLRQNMLVQQEQQLRASVMKTDAFAKANDMLTEAYTPILESYEGAIKEGKTPDQAAFIAQGGLTEANKRLTQGGFLSEQQQRTLPTSFKPIEFRQFIAGSAAYQNWRKEQQQQQRLDIEDRREKDTRDGAGWQVLTDPTKKDADGNPTQYRYNTRTAQSTTLDNQPYTPGGAAKMTPLPKPLAGAEADVRAIADQRIAAEEAKLGRSLSDAEKASIRQQARIDPKVAEAAQKSDSTAIDDDAAKLTAEETLKGDWHGTVGMGRNTASMRKIADWRAKLAKEQGLSGADLAANTAEFNGIMAAERVLGTRGAGIDLGISEAQKFAPMVLDLSSKIDRTRFPTVNSLQLALEKGTGGEDVVRLTDALNAYKMAYTQILTRGGMPTDDSRRRSDEVIDKAWSNGQIKAAIDQLNKEMEAASSAVPAVRDNLYFALTGKERNPAETPSPRPAASTTRDIPPDAIDILKTKPETADAFEKTFGLPAGGAKKYLDGTSASAPAAPDRNAAARTAARAAIDKGADRAKVKQRLKDNHIDASGL